PLEGLDQRVVNRVKVFGGVLVLGRVAAADVTATEAQPQVHPRIADLEAVLTAISAGRHVADLVEMATRGSLGHGGADYQRCVDSSGRIQRPHGNWSGSAGQSPAARRRTRSARPTG